MMSADWAETKNLLLELEQLFSRDNDVSDVLDISKMAKEITLHRESHLKSAKELIKSLTATVASKESEVLAPPESLHAKTIQSLLNEKENANRQYESLRELIDTQHERIKDLAKSRLENSNAQTGGTWNESISDSRTAYALSLYGKITNITWNYEDSEKISGYIANEATKEFKSFEIDKADSPFDIANSLWDLISENTAKLSEP